MKKNKLYNIMFPIWLLIWFPSLLWLLLIPANYFIDLLVLRMTSKKANISKKIINKYSYLACLMGFLADFIGAIFLLIANTFINVSWNPFNTIWSFITVLLAVLLSSFCIFIFNKKLLIKKCIQKENAIYMAKWMAIITAPYLYFIPTMLLYNSMRFY